MLRRLKQFAYAISHDLVALMSGIASVLTGAVASFTTLPAWIFWLVAVACLLVAAFRIWLEERKDNERKDERLRPRLAILDQTENDADHGHHYVRVKSLSDVGCRFGLDLVAVDPPVAGLVLPFPLSIWYQQPYESMTVLPGGQTRPVSVFTNAPDRLSIMGAQSSSAIPRQHCVLTLCAHAELGASVVRAFVVEPRGSSIDFTLQPTTPAP